VASLRLAIHDQRQWPTIAHASPPLRTEYYTHRYKPKMTRGECTEHLMAQGEGSFVVRDSDSNPGWHMLGVKTGVLIVYPPLPPRVSGG
jgi:hypothetical protein